MISNDDPSASQSPLPAVNSSSPLPPSSAAPINLLIVDDDARNLDVLESVLQSHEYKLVRALTAERALHELLDGEFAAIILDIQMPEMSGIELANLIKQRRRTQHIPIIFLTAYFQDDKDVLEGYGIGAVDYLTKPINPQILKSKVAVFVDLFRKTRALTASNAALEQEIIQREHAETALRVLNNELEARVQTRTAELMRLNDELRERGKALRDSERRFRNMADHSPMMLWVTAPSGALTYLNRGWSEFTGQTPDEALGDAWFAVVHPEERTPSLDVFREAHSRREPFRHEYRLLRKDGEYRWALNAAVPRFDESGEFLGHIGSIIDITDRKHAERALEQARDLALAGSRAKDDFLATLSHELRTPLNPVLLLASEAAANRELPDEVRADFELIARSVGLEARLIDDLLDLTRITRGKLALEMGAHDVHAILREAAATVGADIAEKKITLELALDAPHHVVPGDNVRLQQVFWNVLKNAVKFTPAGGLIRVTSAVVPAGGRIEIRISDTGIGLTSEECERAFDAFSQGDHASGPHTHRFGGLGLGLAISRTLVDQHDGSITAESAGRGQGATFVVTLPLAADDMLTAEATRADAGEASPGDSSSSNAGGSRGRVLLVEDHEPTRLALERLLSRRRFEVVSAACLADAREAAASGGFDLLISDIGLPDGNGYDLMAELRERFNLRGVALSGYGMEEDVARSELAGFVFHLTKPIRVQALDKALASLIP
jgi:PAS domain S-box-containing protein